MDFPRETHKVPHSFFTSICNGFNFSSQFQLKYSILRRLIPRLRWTSIRTSRKGFGMSGMPQPRQMFYWNLSKTRSRSIFLEVVMCSSCSNSSADGKHQAHSLGIIWKGRCWKEYCFFPTRLHPCFDGKAGMRRIQFNTKSSHS